jgi:hypothetical protein
MSFILGFLMGLLTAMGLLAFLTYWLCNRSNNIAAAKFINGIAQALAAKGRPPEPTAPANNGAAMEKSRTVQNGKAKD